MSALRMSDFSGGLGQAEIIAAILGPVATAGADVYRTNRESKLSEDELDQRQREFQQLTQFAQEQLEAQERAQILAQHAALQQAAAQQAWWSRNMPLILGTVALLGLGFAATAIARK